MIRMTIALTRQLHMSSSEFQDYWLNDHGKLVKSLAETLGMKHYVQTHAIAPEKLKNGKYYRPPYDGLAEVWYLSYDDFLDHIKSDAGKKAALLLREDEQKFAQTELSRTWWSDEHRLI